MAIEVPELPGYLQSNSCYPVFSDAQLIKWEQMIAATLRTCSVPCILTFGDCRWVECTNCDDGVFGPGMTPLNKSGGCSACNGSQQVAVDEEVELCLSVEYNSSKFEKYADIDYSRVVAQIMTHVEYCPLLMGMKHIQLNTCNSCCDNKRYKIMGDPYPCGFGRRKAFVIVNLESFGSCDGAKN